MIRAVVIDDEKAARELLCRQLSHVGIDIEVVAMGNSVKSGYISINDSKPDVVFLDVELGDGKAFDLLEMFPKITFKTILITAFPDYALNAFRHNVLDYLLKPIDQNELIEACRKISVNGKDDASPLRNEALSKNIHLQTTLIIPHLKGFEILKMNEIIFCKADGYCTNFYLTNKRKIVSSKNLKHYETILDERDFMRVHHSYIINLNCVTSFSKQGEIRLAEENIAMLGDVYREKFLKCISER